MSNKRVAALVSKDLKEVFASKMAVLPIVLVPVILCIVLPVVVLVVFLKLDVNLISGGELLENIIDLYNIPVLFQGLPEQMCYIFFNFTFLPFFMLIPVMVSSVIAANSVVGEKERKTLETLLYTPITNRELLTAKLLASFIPAMIISLISFGGYFAAVGITYYALRGVLLLRSLIWIPALFCTAPAVSLLGLAVTLLVSVKAKTFMEAQQIAGVIVLPFIGLIIIQLTGLLTFNVLYVLIFSAVIGGAAYLIITRIGPRFNREKIISTI